jgi:hypothetical protein
MLRRISITQLSTKRKGELSTSRSGFTQYNTAINASNMANNKTTVKTCIIANKIEISLVVRKTLYPAATSGVTCSNAALIWRE